MTRCIMPDASMRSEHGSPDGVGRSYFGHREADFSSTGSSSVQVETARRNYCFAPECRTEYARGKDAPKWVRHKAHIVRVPPEEDVSTPLGPFPESEVPEACQTPAPQEVAPARPPPAESAQQEERRYHPRQRRPPDCYAP
ncbi:hypothetical protein HPB47_027813 [Ixodes persulcatus]|uniref:Uncharacterized protein n=1 Tax=Ixodes persulcatus TaxID=34615 RepID=A0AC60PVH6_IXOPE|nr:hypothetical protein HPB47_027813 [Ixodes persulcatus]